jgi:hypothetical protein
MPASIGNIKQPFPQAPESIASRVGIHAARGDLNGYWILVYVPGRRLNWVKIDEWLARYNRRGPEWTLWPGAQRG